MSKSTFIPTRKPNGARIYTPRPLSEELSLDQAVALAGLSAAVGNVRSMALRLAQLGLPLPPKKQKLLTELLPKADELELHFTIKYDSATADLTNVIGDTYLELCGLLPFLHTNDIAEVMTRVGELVTARLTRDEQQGTAGQPILNAPPDGGQADELAQAA